MKKYLVLKRVLAVLFPVLCIFTQNVFTQTDIDLPESLGRSLGIYKIHPAATEGFEGFRHFYLEKFPDQDTNEPQREADGKVYVQGEVETDTGEIFRFRTAFVKIVSIQGEEYYRDVEFETVEAGGISYKFAGAFLEDWVQEANGGYTELRGRLTKYKEGSELFSAELPLTKYSTH